MEKTDKDIILSAYLDEYKKWEKNIKAIQQEISEVLEDIYGLEQEMSDTFLGKLRDKISNKDISKRISELKDMLDHLEKRKEDIEQLKPNSVFYELGMLGNNLFYSNWRMR